MKRVLQSHLEARRHRLKRNAGNLLREIGRATLLTGVIATIAAVLVAGFDWMIRSPALSVQETIVRGCKELTEKEILNLAAIRPAPNILTINPEAIARRIRANPWISEVHIGREFPHRLVIVVRERKAVALLQRDEGLYLLDMDGAPFKKTESADEASLPVLTGLVSDGRTNQELLTKSIALINYLAGAKETSAIGAVSEIHGNENFGLSLFTDSGLCLQLGFEGYENKFKRLIPVMADLERKNLKVGFLLIDLSDPTKINVQQRNILGPASPKGPATAGKGHRV
jgi:cell division protein FtsQ